MTFRITRPTLSEDCVKSVKTLFADKRLKDAVPNLLATVEKYLAAFTANQTPVRFIRKGRARPGRTVRIEIAALKRALDRVSLETERVLCAVYMEKYAWPSSIAAQDAHTHILRRDVRGRLGLPVPLWELMGRLAVTCTAFENDYRLRRGAPRDSHILLIRCLMLCFEDFTGNTRMSKALESFVGFILADVAGENTGPDLIKAARRDWASIRHELRGPLMDSLTRWRAILGDDEIVTDLLRFGMKPASRKLREK